MHGEFLSSPCDQPFGLQIRKGSRADGSKPPVPNSDFFVTGGDNSAQVSCCLSSPLSEYRQKLSTAPSFLLMKFCRDGETLK